MSSALKKQVISVTEYLAGEETAQVKHEYLNGSVFAQAGGTNRHNQIASNVIGVLHAQLRSKPCRVFNSDTKIRIQTASGTRFYYPDAMIVCVQNSPSESFQDSPAVIIEVVSMSTRRIDEGEKKEEYLRIPALLAYVIFEQDELEATVFQRVGDEFEQLVYTGLEACVPLLELACKLRFNEVYAGLEQS